MPTDSQQLNEHLQELHDELQGAESLDPEARALLHSVMDDIRDVLQREEGSDGHETLTDRLRDAVSHFEESHPTLTQAAGRVIDALANMGI